MRELAAHGLTVLVPPGWDGTIFRRIPAPGESTFPVIHLATVPLPPERGDFGSGVVETLRRDDVFLCLFEYGPASVGTPLFASTRLPWPVSPSEFLPHGLQRTIPGQAGLQRFFSAAGRAFCLYAVIGGHALRHTLARDVNDALAGVVIGTVPA